MRRFHASLVLLALLSSACRTSEPRPGAASAGTSTSPTADAPSAPVASPAPIAKAPDAPAPAAPAAKAPQPASIPAVPLMRPAAPASQPAPATDAPAPTTRIGRADAAIAEHEALQETYQANFRGVKSAEEYEERRKNAKEPDYGPVMARMWAIVDEDASDDAAFRVLSWMVNEGNPTARVVDTLAKHHAARAEMGPLCYSLVRGEEGHKGFVAELAKSSPHASVRGIALHALTGDLKDRIETARDLQAVHDEKELEQWKQWLGEEGVRKARAFDVAAGEQQLLADLRTIARDYGDVKIRRGTLGEAAQSELFELENLTIGKLAPEIAGEDVAGVPMKLSDYRGKVVVLDFWGNW